jgi:hypothetical protein
VCEDGRAVEFAAIDAFIEPQPGAGPAHQAAKIEFALLKWITAQIVAVQLDQIERIEKHALIIAAIRTRLNEVTPLASQPTA